MFKNRTQLCLVVLQIQVKLKKFLILSSKSIEIILISIIIICPTIRWNETYRTTPWIRSDDRIFIIEPKDKLFEWIGFLSKLFAGQVTLFIVDDIISDETLDKKRQPLLELAISPVDIEAIVYGS